MPMRYLLQQPQKLEDMAIDKLAVWIGIQANNMMSPAAELHKLDESKAETMLSQQIGIIRDRLECNVPRMLHDMLLTKTIAELHRLSCITNNSRMKSKIDATEANINTFRRMVEALFTKHVTSLSLSFDQFNMLRKSLCSKAHMLSGLVRLDLNFKKTNYVTRYTIEIEDDIIQILEELHSLKYLNVIILKTDRILRCVVKNCTLIEELVLDLYLISHDALKILSHLRNLRSITFKMDIHWTETETILLHCKNIEEIHTTFYGYIHISEAIKRLSKKNAGKLKLKFYRCQNQAVRELRMAIRMCPQIQNLIVYPVYGSRHSNENILMAIIDLKDLRELTLLGHHFYTSKVNEALKVIGCNLECLNLIGCSGIDLNAMIEISQMCPNLQSIFLKHCAFVHTQTSNKGELEIPSFKNLKKITLDAGNSSHNQPSLTTQELEIIHEPMFFLLSNSSNVEYIDFVVPCWLTDDSMLRILIKNPLPYLKQLKMWCTTPGPLTTSVMERILKNCINQPEVIETRDDMHGYNDSIGGENIEIS